MDQDPGGPKTFGSGSTTLELVKSSVWIHPDPDGSGSAFFLFRSNYESMTFRWIWILDDLSLSIFYDLECLQL
jgi:hypothetical protein